MFDVKLSSILKSFTKVISDLDKYMQKTSATISSNETTISEMQETNTTLQKDKDKASRIITKLKELIEEE